MDLPLQVKYKWKKFINHLGKWQTLEEFKRQLTEFWACVKTVPKAHSFIMFESSLNVRKGRNAWDLSRSNPSVLYFQVLLTAVWKIL